MFGILRYGVLLLVATPILLAFIPLHQIFDGFDEEMVKGQRVLICGASTGIGEQLAYHYARHGAHVAITARREERLKEVAAEMKRLGAASTVVVPADMATTEGAISAVERTLDAPHFDGELDVLVLNHIIGFWGWFLPDDSHLAEKRLGLPDERWSFDFVEKLFRVNTLSYVTLSTSSIPAMIRASKASKKDSRIVVVSSGAATMGLPKVAPYSATKHALGGFFDSLRLEIMERELPITVTTCILGRIDTENQKVATGDDLQHVAAASPSATAYAILRGGTMGLRDIFVPLDQALHVMCLVRPFMRSLIDQVVLVLAQ